MTQEAKVIKWNCHCGNSYTFHGFTEASQRQWVGLTNNEIADATKDIRGIHCAIVDEIAQAIEAKLKEKNT
jgi:hypothetical protein